MGQHTIYLALGSNLGDKERNINTAYEKIEKSIGTIIKRSSLHKTEPWGFRSENYFLNSAVCCSTALSPYELLHETQKIEREMGRTKKSDHGRYHDRIIDIDILLYDNISMDTPQLTIPHPSMGQRDFVIAPMKELGIDNIADKQNSPDSDALAMS